METVFTESHTLKFDQPFKKILKLSLAYDNTFVILAVEDAAISESITHVDNKGRILSQFLYQNTLDTFALLNDKEVIVLNIEFSQIDIINLSTKIKRTINHQFSFDDSVLMELHTFTESKYLCLSEHGPTNEHRLILSYFALINNDLLAIQDGRYESSQAEYTYENTLVKGNDVSMMIWFRTRHQSTIGFSIYEVCPISGKGNYRYISFNNTMGGELMTQNRIVCEISNIWQTDRNNYMIVSNSNKHEGKGENEPYQFNNNYIYDDNKKILREFKCTFPGDWNLFLIECINLGAYSVFHTYKFLEGKPIKSPVFLVNNREERFISETDWVYDCYKNIQIPGFGTGAYIEAQYDTGDVKVAQIKVRQIFEQKHCYLQFLLHLNEDFDDDLLKDSIELLEENY